MRVALLGATGTIGSAYMTRALGEGHELRALIRQSGSVEPGPHLTVLVGDARDPSAVTQLLARSDAVVSAVGPRTNTPHAVELLEATATNVIAAMRAHGLTRVIFVAGAGVALPDEHRGLGQRAVSAIVRRLAKWVVTGKERELTLYLQSGLEWTAIRPPRVIGGPRTGRARLVNGRPGGLRVTSGDVADAIAAALADPTTIGTAPYVST